MADIVVRAPNGAIVEIPEAQYQDALDQGYTNVDQSEAEAARDEAIATVGDDEAVTAGLLEAPADYDSGLAAREKILSGFTFGQAAELQTPESRARGRRFTAEHPGESMLYEGVGQLPYAIAGAAGGAAAGAAVRGAGLLARGGVAAADFAGNALVGGAQVEGEATRLSGEDFSFTDAAIIGSVGEVLGRGAGAVISRGVGGARNLLAKGEREVVAQDAAEGLARGGWVRDYQTAQHAEVYHNQLADLASRDLDTLESAFTEVSRQDRKRARIVRQVIDNPAAQREVNIAAATHLRALQTALSSEITEAPAGPARNLARQLQERIDVLDQAPSGKSLWRALDENRQALQEYRQDLYQAYETNPGSAWLSREGLAAIDAAEKSTREALLREDVWGAAAAAAQREYNEPFHGKWFPARKTVVGKLHFEQQRNAEGFAVYRGDPDALRKFLGRDLAEPDGARLSEQFTQYLDGAEAIARAGAKDAPRASRDALEAIRRLRKAQANAAQVTAAVQRTTRRTTGINQAAMAAGAASGMAAGGPGGAALGALAARGARVGEWLSKAGTRLGWGAGKPLDMAALLGRDALPEAVDEVASLTNRLTDDIIEGPFRPASDLPAPAGPGGPLHPQPTRAVGVADPSLPADRAGVGPVRLDPRGQAVQPRGVDAIQPQRSVDVGAPPGTEPPPPVGRPTRGATGRPPEAAGPTPIDDLAPEPVDDAWTPDVEPRRGSPTRPTPDRNEAIDWYGEVMAPGRSARAAEAERLDAISRQEFDDLVTRLRDVGAKTPDGQSMADVLAKNADRLIAGGLIVAGLGAEALSDETEGAVGAGAGLLAVATLGKSKLLGAKFYGRSAAAQRVVAEAVEQLPPPPPLRGYAFQSEAMKNPGIRQLFEVSRKAARDLSNDELGAVSDWVATSAGIRHEQRTGLRKFYDRPAAVFQEAIEKLTVVDPTKHGELYRHMDLPDEALAELLTRDEYVADAAFSTAYYPDSYFGAHQFRFTKVERAGALIGANPSEAEMVIPHDSRFRVTGRYADPETGNFVFELEEIPETSSSGLTDVGYLSIAGALGAGAAAGADEDPAAAGAMAPMALFGARASMFRGVRARAVAQAARQLFSATADAVPRVTARLAYSRAQIEERQREFQAWQANPAELVERVAEGFRDVPPEHSGTVAGGVFRAASFLREKLPSVARTNAMSVRQIPVSSEAMAKYARYEQAALTPRDAIAEAAESRHISTELLETLQALYPDLLAEWRVQAYLQVREAGPPATIQGRLSYAQLFDGDGSMADPAFSTGVAQMANAAYEAAVPPKPPVTGSSGTVSRAAVSVAAPGPLGRG